MDLVAIDGRALVGEGEWVIRLADLYPAQAHANLWVEGLGTRIVGLAVALCLVQLEADGVGHVLPARLPVGRHTPVGAVGFLKAANAFQGRANQILHARWNAQGLLRLKQLGLELVSLGIVHLAVGNGAPLARLVVDFLVNVTVLGNSQLAIWGVYWINLGLGVLHGGVLNSKPGRVPRCSPCLWWPSW